MRDSLYFCLIDLLGTEILEDDLGEGTSQLQDKPHSQQDYQDDDEIHTTVTVEEVALEPIERPAYRPVGREPRSDDAKRQKLKMGSAKKVKRPAYTSKAEKKRNVTARKAKRS